MRLFKFVISFLLFLKIYQRSTLYIMNILLSLILFQNFDSGSLLITSVNSSFPSYFIVYCFVLFILFLFFTSNSMPYLFWSSHDNKLTFSPYSAYLLFIIHSSASSLGCSASVHLLSISSALFLFCLHLVSYGIIVS